MSTARELLLRLGAGDLSVARAVDAALRPYAHSYLRGREKNDTQLEETVQDTMLAVLSDASAYNGVCAPTTWLKSIARYRQLSNYQHRTRLKRTRVDFQEIVPETQTFRFERERTRLRDAWATLEEDDQCILYERFVEEESDGTSTGRMRVRSALAKLTRAYKRHENFTLARECHT